MTTTKTRGGADSSIFTSTTYGKDTRMTEIGWGPDVYGDAVKSAGWTDMDPPPKDPGAPFIEGDSATGWGRSDSPIFGGMHYYPGFAAKLVGGAGLSGA